MPMHVKVLIGQTLVGTLAEIDGAIYFEYAAAFLQSGQALSPLHLPLREGATLCNKAWLQNLPGLCFDSLPDAWGERVMERWFQAQQKRGIESVTALEQLCFIGDRGVGALRYEPMLIAQDPLRPGIEAALDLRRLEVDARAVIESEPTTAIPSLIELARNGTAGGARPKIWIGVKEEAGAAGQARLIAGARELPADYSPWLLKLDVPKLKAPYREYGRVEHAYAMMAGAAGLRCCRTRLFTAQDDDGNERAHFAISRFDRDPAGNRIHFHSLAGMTEADFDTQIDYRELLSTTQQVSRDQTEVLEAFRRAAFNVATRVCDDHAKNHGFLYKNGLWRLSPAYDMVYAAPGRFRRHAMPVAGNAVSPGPTELAQLADESDLAPGAVADVIERCRKAVDLWPQFAENAGVSAARALEIAAELPGRLWSPILAKKTRKKP